MARDNPLSESTIGDALAHMGLLAAGDKLSLRAARGRRVLGHLARRDRRAQILPQARSAAAQGGEPLAGAGRAQRRRMEVAGDGRDDLARLGAASGRARPRRRPVRHGISRSRPLSELEKPIARRRAARGDGAGGRRAAGRDSRRHRRTRRYRRRIRHRRLLLRHPARALFDRHRPCAPGSRAATGSAIGQNAGDQMRAGAWRRQPEKYPDRPGRSAVHRSRNAPGTASPPSTSPFASTICC